MGQVRDYEALIRELLAGVAGGWGYGGVKGWLMGKGVKEPELVGWLREHGAALGADEVVRGQLGCLAGLGRGELAEVAGELVRGWEPEVDESDEWFYKGFMLGNLGRYVEELACYDRAIHIKPDYEAAWLSRGAVLCDFLGEYEKSLESFDRVIQLNSDSEEAWYNRGFALGNLERFEEAIVSYDRAIKLNSDNYQSWSNKGDMLNYLERYEEAISSCDRAIQIQPDFCRAWYNQGNALAGLGKNEEAITSYDRVTKLQPDYQQAWHNQGTILGKLDRNEEALFCFNKAIQIQPHDYKAWYDRGVALFYLHQYALALDSFNETIRFKPDEAKAWCNKGHMLVNLEKYKEAISSCDTAIQIQPDDHLTWFNRGTAIGRIQGYQAGIDAYQQAFQHIHPDIHPKGWGYLQHMIGRAHYQEGQNQLFNYRKNPQTYYNRALTSYGKALQTITREQFPKLRLDTLIGTAAVYLAQHNPTDARECQLEALDILRDLLNAQPTFAGKKRLQIEYVSLSQLDVDLFVASGDNIRALQAAELDKNNHLIWLLSALEERTISPSYAQMQQLLASVTGNRVTGIVYWHLSYDNLTTFILHPHNSAPEVLTSPSQHLQTWLKTYDDSDNLDTANWQELANILQISEINRHLNGIEHLILIPHRDLHRLPLHIYWEKLTITYLPSIQIGLNLQAKPQPNLAAGLLLIESPAYHAATTQSQKDKPLDILLNAEIEAAILEYLFQPKTIVRSGAVSQTQLQTDLNRPHYYGHFNGHAYHNPRHPQESSLILDGDDVLACADLAAIDLQPYHLISLSACQTGVTTHQTIDTEYVGLVSAFLSRGTNYVVSTLWSVADLPSSLLMMVFYIYIKKGIPAPLALRQAASWLRNLTHAKEAEFHGNIYQWLDPKSSTARSVDRNRQNALAAAQAQPDEKPYGSPKYWAAFTISGWG